MTSSVMARVVIKPYANKVINMVKAKYELPDKSSAINKFFELHGPEEFDEPVSDAYVRKILKMERQHYAKYGRKTQTIAQLRKEIEGIV